MKISRSVHFIDSGGDGGGGVSGSEGGDGGRMSLAEVWTATTVVSLLGGGS